MGTRPLRPRPEARAESRGAGKARSLRVEPAAGLSTAQRAGRKPHDQREGGAGPLPLLRQAPVPEPDAIVRHLPPPGEGLHRRPRPWVGIYRPTASAWADEPGERGVQPRAHVGQSADAHIGGAGARSSVRREPHRARHDRQRGSPAPAPQERRALSEAVRGSLPAETNRFTIRAVTQAIASFERTILSGDSPYDRYKNGDDRNAISEPAKRGEALFFSERLECFHCHGGFNLTGTVDYLDKGFAEVEFHNTGLYNLAGKFSYPPPNLGLYEFSHQEEDVGKFKAPTLRNIAVPAPHMQIG